MKRSISSAGRLILLGGMLFSVGCRHGDDDTTHGKAAANGQSPIASSSASVSAEGSVQQEAPAATDAFLAAVRTHCGESFAGRVIKDVPPPAEPDAFGSSALVMHVRHCGDDEVRIPFHVGDDHSRTWVLTRTSDGLRLKHDHRHEDGSSDAVTMYGGDSSDSGTVIRQEFPVDAESIENFKANGLNASLNNTWAMEIEPGKRFLYELSRPSGRLFQVEFDLSTPVATPPAPWGSEPAPASH